jgi:hypothetical protein
MMSVSQQVALIRNGPIFWRSKTEEMSIARPSEATADAHGPAMDRGGLPEAAS